MICKLKFSHLSIFIVFALVIMLVAMSFELFKIGKQEEAPPLKYMTQTITNTSGKSNDAFAKDVMRWMLKLRDSGHRVIELIIDDEDGKMLRAHIYYLPGRALGHKKPEVDRDEATKNFG